MKPLHRKASCHPDRPHVARGLCRLCYNQDWKARYPELAKKHRQQSWRRWCETTGRKSYTRHGVSKEDWAAKLEAQDHKCAICGEFLTKPHLDHNHDTGQVRKMLCNGCNLGLGHFKESPVALRAAAEYLESMALTGVMQ